MELSPRQQAQAANLRTHLTEGEISDLLELARKTDPRAWAIFALSFNHGLRVTEVPNLRLDGDINWKDRTVRIARLKGSMTTTQALVEMRGSLRCQRYLLCEPISRSESRTVRGSFLPARRDRCDVGR
jgi:integrase